MMIVAVLSAADVLAVYVTVIVAFPLPLAGETVNHVASLVIDQEVFEVKLKVILPAPAVTLRLEGETVSNGTLFWVTVTCCEGAPVADTVIVAVLEVDDVLAVQVAVTVPLPLPFEMFNVSQMALSETVQAVLELIVKIVVPASALTRRADGVTESIIVPLWVIVT
jgi:hypothetical protein